MLTFPRLFFCTVDSLSELVWVATRTQVVQNGTRRWHGKLKIWGVSRAAPEQTPDAHGYCIRPKLTSLFSYFDATTVPVHHHCPEIQRTRNTTGNRIHAQQAGHTCSHRRQWPSSARTGTPTQHWSLVCLIFQIQARAGRS